MKDELDEMARATVVAILAESGGSITRGKLSAAVFKRLPGDPDRGAITTRVHELGFLMAKGMPWSYDERARVLTLSNSARPLTADRQPVVKARHPLIPRRLGSE